MYVQKKSKTLTESDEDQTIEISDDQDDEAKIVHVKSEDVTNN